MHEARAIDEDVGRTERSDHLLRERIDRGGRAHIELVAPGRGEAFELARIEIGRDHRRALGDEGFADGASDPLPRGGDERDLAVQSIGHCLTRHVGAEFKSTTPLDRWREAPPLPGHSPLENRSMCELASCPRGSGLFRPTRGWHRTQLSTNIGGRPSPWPSQRWCDTPMRTFPAKCLPARYWRRMLVAAVVVFSVHGEAARHGAVAQADVAAFLAGATKNCPGCNLPGANLKRRDLAGANLAGANLRGASFHRAVLRGANLAGADLTEANLNKTDLIQADLSNAKLAKAMLFEADASRADFSRANLTEALMGSIRLLGGKLERAILTEADLEAALLNEASFANATLNGANLHQGRILRVNLHGAAADSTEFTQANLRDANLSRAVLRESDVLSRRSQRRRSERSQSEPLHAALGQSRQHQPDRHDPDRHDDARQHHPSLIRALSCEVKSVRTNAAVIPGPPQAEPGIRSLGAPPPGFRVRAKARPGMTSWVGPPGSIARRSRATAKLVSTRMKAPVLFRLVAERVRQVAVIPGAFFPRHGAFADDAGTQIGDDVADLLRAQGETRWIEVIGGGPGGCP